MIKATDLRCGNILEYFIGEEGIEWDKTTIDAQDILWAQDNPDDFNQVHRAVKLSPAWLERAGYAWSGGDHWEDKSGKIWIEDRAGLYRICKPFLGIYKIEFVHQFQNTIYINFGNELIFNP